MPQWTIDIIADVHGLWTTLEMVDNACLSVCVSGWNEVD